MIHLSTKTFSNVTDDSVHAFFDLSFLCEIRLVKQKKITCALSVQHVIDDLYLQSKGAKCVFCLIFNSSFFQIKM
jgi:hypothetical protein